MTSNEQLISKGVNWTVIFLYLVLVIIGFIAIFSVEFHPGDDLVKSLLGLKTNYSKQLLYLTICMVLAIFILITDSKFFYGHC